jgi:hypothetical protein
MMNRPPSTSIVMRVIDKRQQKRRDEVDVLNKANDAKKTIKTRSIYENAQTSNENLHRSPLSCSRLLVNTTFSTRRKWQSTPSTNPPLPKNKIPHPTHQSPNHPHHMPRHFLPNINPPILTRKPINTSIVPLCR